MWQKTTIFLLLISFKIALISSQGIISCNYQQQPGEPYSCTLSINNPDGDDFESIPGQHAPGFGNDDVTFLTANNQNSRNFPAAICRQFPNLRNINIAMSGIQEIDETTFAGCGNLWILSLAMNNISSIPDNTFRGNAQLQSVVLGRNAITTISADSFTGSSISYLDLSYNQIRAMVPTSLCSISETLSTLYLISNELTALPDNTFNCLVSLQHLHLSGNTAITIPSTAFQSLRFLITLSLIDCGLTELNPNWFNGLTSLTEVHLESNALTSLPDNVFANSRRLTNVFLSSNNLTEITSLPFGTNLQALEILTLVGNSIRGIARDFFAVAENLHSLYLNGNDCSNENFEYDFDDRNRVARQLERCFRGLGSDMISCVYEMSELSPDEYICHMTVRNPIGNEFTAIDGEHLAGQGNDNVLIVDIINGNTRNLPQIVCQQFPNLKSLLIRTSYLEIINSQAFSNCRNLERLHIGDNLIIQVPDNTFANSPRLEELYLGTNLIEIIGANAFAGTALKLLDLSFTFVGTVDNAWLTPIRSSLEVLDLLDIKAVGLPANAFEGLTNLRSLYLDFNVLTEMSGNIFNSLTNLRDLSLISTGLVTLNPDWFTNLSNLDDLEIKHNELTELPVGIFNPLVNAGKICFDDNRIVEVRADHFGASLPSIHTIRASGNGINAFDAAILDQATSLNALELVNNQCTDTLSENIGSNLELTRQALANCTANFQLEPTLSCEYDRMITGRIYWCQMTALNPLGSDNFESVEGRHLPGSNDDAVMYVEIMRQNTMTVPSAICRQFESMQVLDIISSNLGVITEDSFQSCNFLRELTIMNNNIQSIPSQAFTAARNHLHVLVLADNQIRDLSVYAFAGTEIQELDLSFNRIRRFDPYTYSHIGNTLMILRLNGNEMQSLPPNAFDSLTNLVDLELNGNMIVTIPHNAFLRNTNLRILQISSNRLERLEPGMFQQLTNLNDLELSVNRLSLLPENIFDLPNLRVLGLVQNEIRGLVAASFGRSLNSLINIDASINRINSFDAEMIGSASNLRELNMNYNDCSDEVFRDIPDFRDDVLRSLSGCIGVYNNASVGCVYGFDDSNDANIYGCQLTIDNEFDRMRFDRIEGQHLTGRNNDDVMRIIAIEQNSRSVPGILCQTFSNLMDLTFAGSNVEILAAESFNGCENLFTLNMANNRIAEIPEGIFHSTPGLNILQLPNNRISMLTPTTFEGAEIHAINLEINNLRDFNPAWFRPVSMELSWLFLTNNQIRRFPRNAFIQFPELAILELSGNPDIFVPSNAFTGLNHMLILLFSNCGIKNLNHRWFDDLPGLMQLEMDSNEVEELPDRIFDLQQLVYLGIAYNRLSVLDSAAFGEHLRAMKTIEAEHNLIDAIDRNLIDGATALVSLSLIGNNCIDLNFLDVVNNRPEMIESLQQCFDNFQRN